MGNRATKAPETGRAKRRERAALDAHKIFKVDLYKDYDDCVECAAVPSVSVTCCVIPGKSVGCLLDIHSGPHPNPSIEGEA